MIPVWLYAADGRALYCVYVITPQPVEVTYAGLYFYWNGTRYVQASVRQSFQAQEEVPEGQRPPKGE